MISKDFKDIKIPGYEIVDKLGRGAMAQVFLAMQVALDRKVALKIMAENLLVDSEYSERFLREAKIVAQLSHPNIVSVYDVGVFQGCHYLSMEYHRGGDLKQRIKRGINIEDAFRFSRQISLALRFAHNEGYIHRDVKPENILFDRNDNAILTDFGIARSGNTSSDMTAVGTIMGTPKYMSPEQAQGIDVDGRSDLYSLGVMIFEMLSGYPPYDAENAIAICHMHINQPIPELPAPLQGLQELINKTMAKNPADRVASGDDIIKMLDELSDLRLTQPVSQVGENEKTLLRKPGERGQHADYATADQSVDSDTASMSEKTSPYFGDTPQSMAPGARASSQQTRPKINTGHAARLAVKPNSNTTKKMIILAVTLAITLAAIVIVKISLKPPELNIDSQHDATNTVSSVDNTATELIPVSAGLLSSLQILAPQNQALCTSDTPYRDGTVRVKETQRLRGGDCFSIQVETLSDVDLIIISQSEDGTVYRLLPNSCNAMGLQGQRFKAGTSVLIPLNGKKEMTVIGLDEKAGQEWIYAVAVQDTQSRQAVLDSLPTVPDVCGGTGGTMQVSEVQNTLDAVNRKLSNSMQWLAKSFQHVAK